MTEIEYKIVVKLMIEKLERLKDEIAEKDAEIERLKNNISAMATTLRNSAKATRAEAYKVFAERVFALFPCDKNITTISRFSVKQIVKEMVGGNNDR